ncbi:MAG: hypothetical protein WA828_12470 [Coleofasciculaceae cyanobacterium]
MVGGEWNADEGEVKGGKSDRVFGLWNAITLRDASRSLSELRCNLM